MIPARKKLALPALLLVAGCAVGPDFHTPAPPAVSRYSPAETPSATSGIPMQRMVVGAPVAARWWTLFNSPRLDALEEEALKANPDLKSAQAALRQARETYLADRAALFPEVSLGLNATRAKNSLTIAPVLANNSEYYTLYQGQLTLSYVLDVFGGTRRSIEASAAQAETQRFETEAAYLTLTTNVANAVLQLAALQAQMDATTRIVSANRQTLELVRRQQQEGQASGADVAAARAALEQAEQLAPPLQKQLDLQRDLLATLLGRPTANGVTETFELSDFSLPRDLPVSLPADLVRQRPDIRSAEASLHAASAQLGVAIAARLPSFTISGAAGGASSEISSLLSNGNSLWSISGDIAQTVFDAGALRHKQKAAEAALDQAKAQYQSAVLAGLQNTSDVLHSVVDDSATEQHARAADQAAGEALTIARAQMEQGGASILPVLAAEAAYQQAETALAQAEGARYADTISLFQALGGGWWNREQAVVP
jgi:NodT family efflux transporter outer membrane factor (OMF) lipoprotein